MNVSVFRNFIEIKDKLANQAYNNNFVIANLDKPLSVEGKGLNADGITSNIESGVMNIKAYDGTVSTVQISTIYDHLDDYINGTSITLGDYLNSASNSGDLYAELSAVTAKFSYSSRMTLTDLNQIIDSVKTNSTNYSISNLKSQLVAVSDNNGYVSGRNWLICLQNWMESAYDAADDNRPSLDTTSAFALDGVYSIIVSVVSNVLSAICYAMKGIFSAILTVVSAILNCLFNAINAYFSDQMTLNWDSTNSFVKGPICAALMMPWWYLNFPSYSAFGNTYKILYSEANGIGTYMWRVNKNEESGINVNSYLYPCYHPEAVARWIQLQINSGILVRYPTYLAVNPGLNTAISNTPSNSDSEQASLCLNSTIIMQSLLVDAFYRWVRSTPTDWYMNNDPDSHMTFATLGNPFMSGGTSHGTTSKAKRIMNAVEIGGRIVFGIIDYNDPLHNTNISQMEDVLRNYVQELNDSMGNPLLESYEMFTSALGSRCVISNANICAGFDVADTGFKQVYHFNASSETSSFSTEWRDGSNSDRALHAVNCIPNGDYFITLKSVTLSDLIAVLSVGLVVATAAAVTYNLSSRAIDLKKTQKSTLRVSDIQQKREAFLADPKNKEKGLAYAKAVRKYNRLGRLFGWGTYDGVNDWIDYPDNSGTSEVVTGLTALWSNQDAIDDQTSTLNSSIRKTSGSPTYSVESATDVIISKLDQLISLIK